MILPPGEPTATKRWPARLAVAAALCALFALHTLANLWWLRHDHHSIMSDESMHMNYAREFYETLVLDQDSSIPEKLLNAFDAQVYYPPLIHILAAGLLAAIGYSIDNIALIITFFFLVLLLGMYLIARQFLPRWQAFFTTTIVSLTPLLFGGSRYFMTDYLSAVFTVWAIYCLIKSDWFRRTDWVFLFALLNGLGIMARQTTFVFYFIPCIVTIVVGLASVGSKQGYDRPLRLILLNCAITLVVTLGVFLPWYLHHFHFLEVFWTEQFFEGRGIFDVARGSQKALQILAAAGAGLAVAVVAVLALAWERRVRPESGWRISRPARFFANAVALFALLALLLTNERWSNYAAFLVQDGIYLPFFILMVLGVFLALNRWPFRPPILLCALWLLGSYVLLTFLFSSQVSRYLIPAAPVLGLFAALPVCLIPQRLLRLGAMALLLAFSLFQWANMTFGPLGEGEKMLPPLTSNRKFSELARFPMPLYKYHLIAGDYAFHAAQREDGFADRIIKTMIRDMKERRPVLADVANYQKLTDLDQFEGLWFQQLHYWPLPNSFALPDTAALSPVRIHDVGTRWQSQPEELLDHLPSTDYVLMKIGVNDRVGPAKLDAEKQKALEKEKTWRQYFEKRGFEVIDHFYEPRYNIQTGGFFTVMGRRLVSRKVVRTFDFAATPKEEWEWRFQGEVAQNEQGALRTTRNSGPVAANDNVAMEATEFSAVRIYTDLFRLVGEERIPAAPRNMHAYWARPGDFRPGQFPFADDRAMRFNQIEDGVWEAEVVRHPEWSRYIQRFMIGMDLPGISIEGMKPVSTWDFTTLPKAGWDWIFEKGADRAPNKQGAMWMSATSGPLARLDKTYDARAVDAVYIKLDVFHTTTLGNAPLEQYKVNFYWAGPDHVKAGAFPFAEARAVSLQATDEEGLWSAPLSLHPAWKGTIEAMIFVLSFPPEVLQDETEHFTVFAREIGLLDAAGNIGNFEQVVRQIEFLN